MRIISGNRKGHKLKSPDGINTRPTSDRVKESIFNIIQTHLPAENVLDLFAGSGAMGIEALSRGSTHATFIENEKSSFNIVRANLESSRFENNAKLILGDAIEYLENSASGIDIIFLDPPYNKGFIAPIIRKISERNLLKIGGLIVIESDFDGEDIPTFDFNIIKKVKYGRACITVLQR